MISPQDSVGVQVADISPRTLHEAYVPKDTLAAADLRTVSETVTGVDGISIPYSPRVDGGLAMILPGCFFISSYVLARSKKFLLQQAKDFMLYHERTNIFASSTAANMHCLLLLIVQTCVLGGACIFNYSNDIRLPLMECVSPHVLLGVCVAVCIFYFLFKWIVYSFLEWMFSDRSKTDIWLESCSTLIYYLGFVLFPFVLFLIYFDLNTTFLVSIGYILVIFTKILMFYKWLKLFFRNIYGVFFSILYFCVLEIIPCLVVYQGLIQLNNVSIINF